MNALVRLLLLRPIDMNRLPIRCGDENKKKIYSIYAQARAHDTSIK